LRFFFCRFLSECAAGLFPLLAVVRRLSNLIFTFLKIQIGGNKEWHITTDVRTGNGASGKKPRKRFCVSMALMKRSLSKSAWRTGLTLIPTGGFTDGRAILANTLRE